MKAKIILIVAILLLSSLSFADGPAWKQEIKELKGFANAHIWYFQFTKIWIIDGFLLTVDSRCKFISQCVDQVIERHRQFLRGKD